MHDGRSRLCHWDVVRRYLISQHPEVEEKILAELADLHLLKTEHNPKPREMTYADLSKLTYLNAVIKVPHSRSHARLFPVRFNVLPKGMLRRIFMHCLSPSP